MNSKKRIDLLALLCVGAMVCIACSNNYATVEVLDTLAIDALDYEVVAMEDYDGLLEEMIDEINDELPIVFADFITLFQFSIDEDNLNIYYVVNEDNLSMATATRNMQQNRKAMLPHLFTDTERLTQEDKRYINDEYGITGNFKSVNGLIVHCLYETDRGVSINLIGSDERVAQEVVTYSPHELHRAYKD